MHLHLHPHHICIHIFWRRDLAEKKRKQAARLPRRTFFRPSSFLARKRSSWIHASFPACGATVRGTRTTRPRLHCTCRPQEAGTRSPQVQYGGPGAYVSTHFPPWSVPPSSLRRWSSSAQHAWGRPWSHRKCARLPTCQSRRPRPYCPYRSRPCARRPERVSWVAWVAWVP